MPIIDKASLATHVYAEIITEITREDDTIIDAAIANAVEEASMYLSRYDLDALLGADGGTREPTFISPLLAGLVKDITVWQIVKLANPNMRYDHIRKCYDDAVATLRDIQAGKADPRWPYLDATGLETPPGISVSIHANEKRSNGY
jgi:hypothetical protein